ncbi:oxidoreductase [Micropruina sp.]|uniref:NAD(P)H-dependent oxidoreductase n=1 Tax=Micropruina sp. TaxID=2737536 RepID=UPI00262E534D|nr:oxidoreductase [Micropruina sp.]
MSYSQRLLARERSVGRPVRVGVVGAGQMGSGLVAQINRVPGLFMSAVADIDVTRAERALAGAGCDRVTTTDDLTDAAAVIEAGESVAISDGLALTRLPLDVIVEVSGVPDVAAEVAYASLLAGKDTLLMTVEADVTVGLLLAGMANAGGAIYSICRGDEPVECLKLIEYAEDIGLEVVVAGKGKNNPNRPTDTPTDVRDEAIAKGMNPKMLSSFTDGTKTQVEMCALSNATGYPVDVPGMHGVPCSIDELATKLVPASDGGIVDHDGPVVEYVTGNVAPGVFVIVKSGNDVVTHELDYLRLGTGPYYAIYRPYHLASIEANLSIGEAVIDRRPSFQPSTWTSEVVAVAKSDLKAGLRLEGIGGHHVYGQAMPAGEARDHNSLPVGLAAGCVLTRDVAAGQKLSYADVTVDETRPIVAMRRLQDAMLANGTLGSR